MTPAENSYHATLIMRAMESRQPAMLALGWLRYEALRQLSPQQYAELYKRNIAGERFDSLVDELVVQQHLKQEVQR